MEVIWTPKNFGPPDYRALLTMGPMGWWQITFDKTKEGVHLIIYDSIYLDMGATEEYYLPW
ncbi:MAG: hypothetical protein HY738_02100 [Bacteroidia bacterium]|nr:hypothetical protein [Bacteroidia bacterium]